MFIKKLFLVFGIAVLLSMVTANALDCVTVQSYSVEPQAVWEEYWYYGSAACCPEGYTVTGGGCGIGTETFSYLSNPYFDTGNYWACNITTSGPTELSANARCCREDSKITGRLSLLESFINTIICQLLPKGLVKGLSCPVY